MDIFTNAWNWLNGKKTNIGAACLLVALFLTEVVVKIWHVDTPWITPTIQTFEWLGAGLTTPGLLHKFLKK